MLFDLTGKAVRSERIAAQRATLSMAGLSKGIYLLEVGDRVHRIVR